MSSAIKHKVRMKAITKRAAMAGEADTPFEQAFSNLAHAYLRDKAPGLTDYEVGFQLVDKSSDNTKAMGLFGFKVGDRWLYAPVFFINGDLKGHELLYIKDQDMFVPLKENWLNYITNRKPNILGKEVGTDMKDNGVVSPDLESLYKSPSKYASSVAPWARDIMPVLAHIQSETVEEQEKSAAHMDLPTFLKEAGEVAVRTFVETCRVYPKFASQVDKFYGLNKLLEDVAQHTEKQAQGPASILKDPLAGVVNPAQQIAPPSPYGAGVVGYHPGNIGQSKGNAPPLSVGGSAKQAPTYMGDGARSKAMAPEPPFQGPPTWMRPDPQGPPKALSPNFQPSRGYIDLRQSTPGIMKGSSDLTALTYKEIRNRPVLSTVLPDEALQAAMAEGLYIMDKRAEEDTSEAYDTESTLQLLNPNQTGLYDVLVKPGSIEKCLVITPPVGDRKTYKQAAVLIKIGEDKDWVACHPSRIFATKQYENDEFKSWWNSLPDCDSLSPGKYDELNVILSKSANGSFNSITGTFPFTVDKEHGVSAGGDTKHYAVNFRDYADYRFDQPEYQTDYKRDTGYKGAYFHGTSEPTIILTKKAGAEIRAANGTVMVPSGCKLLKLGRSSGAPDCCDDMGASRKTKGAPLAPAGILDVQLSLRKALPRIKTAFASDRYIVDGATLDKVDALVHLVRDHGLRRKEASLLLEDVRKKKRTEYYIKYAANYPQQSGPNAPSFPEMPSGDSSFTGGVVETTPYYEASLPVDDLSSKHTDKEKLRPSQVPDPQTMKTVSDAANTGQKELFDTSAIGSLMKATRDDSMVDQYIGDIMKGMDRKGRIYLHMCWKRDKFEDRYGKSDLPAIEDALRTAFEGDGDLVLSLKEREITDYDQLLRPDMDSAGGDESEF